VEYIILKATITICANNKPLIKKHQYWEKNPMTTESITRSSLVVCGTDSVCEHVYVCVRVQLELLGNCWA